MNVLKFYPTEQSQSPVSSDVGQTRETANHNAGLDLVRGLAALGVVLLHACVPYLRHPMPGLRWPVTDSASEATDLVFWSIELFIMPVFLVIAGFLLTPTLTRRGPIGMLQTRWKRLARPLMFGVLVVLPIDFYLWLCGWVSEGIIPLVKLKSLKFDGDVDRDLWGLSHLWFLLYVLTYIVLIAAGAVAAKRYILVAKLVDTLQRPRVLLPILVTVAVLTLCARPEVVWGFQHRFEPVPSKWIYSLTFFIAGVAWAKHDPRLQQLSRLADRRMIALASVAWLGALLIGRWHLEVVGTGSEPRTARVLLAGLTVAAAWMITLTGIAVAVRKPRRVLRLMQYLAGASFWLYLVHHPLLVLVHIDLKWLLPSVPGAVKMFVSFAAAITVSLAMYEVWVRHTWLGRWSGLGETNSPSLAASDVAVVLELPNLASPSVSPQKISDKTPAPARRAA